MLYRNKTLSRRCSSCRTPPFVARYFASNQQDKNHDSSG